MTPQTSRSKKHFQYGVIKYIAMLVSFLSCLKYSSFMTVAVSVPGYGPIVSLLLSKNSSETRLSQYLIPNSDLCASVDMCSGFVSS